MLKKLNYYLKLTKAYEIARRYFIINAFDGVLTIFGIIVGAFTVNHGSVSPLAIITIGLGATIAMFISGASGTYLSEKAEKLSELKEIERAMIKDLKKSEIGKASKRIPFVIAFIDGFSPALVSLIILFPFFLAVFGLFPERLLFHSSVFLSLLILFILGLFLGKISKENILLFGLKTLLIGIVTALIISSLRFFN